MAKNNKTKNAAVSVIRYGADASNGSADRVAKSIRERAYQLYEQRGHQPGHELDDWLQAEREMTWRPDIQPQ